MLESIVEEGRGLSYDRRQNWGGGVDNGETGHRSTT